MDIYEEISLFAKRQRDEVSKETKMYEEIKDLHLNKKKGD